MTYLAGDVNPLDGTPLKPGQVLVYGPETGAGPRVTVVYEDDPTSWPAWIVPDPYSFRPVDNGAAGGTYLPQQLPELTVTGSALPAWVWLVGAIVLLMLLDQPKRKRRRR